MLTGQGLSNHTYRHIWSAKALLYTSSVLKNSQPYGKEAFNCNDSAREIISIETLPEGHWRLLITTMFFCSFHVGFTFRIYTLKTNLLNKRSLLVNTRKRKRFEGQGCAKYGFSFLAHVLWDKVTHPPYQGILYQTSSYLFDVNIQKLHLVSKRWIAWIKLRKILAVDKEHVLLNSRYTHH